MYIYDENNLIKNFNLRVMKNDNLIWEISIKRRKEKLWLFLATPQN